MIDSPEILKVLEIAPLFHGVPAELLARNLSQSNLRTLKAGEILLASGQANNQVYIIISGHLSIQTKESHVEPIVMLGEGECVGEMSILGDGHASAYVIAATDCKLLIVNYDALWKMIEGSHVAARNMLGILSKRIRIADQIIAENLEQQNGYTGVSVIDELTGLYNQQWMQKKFNRLLQRNLRNKIPCCIMILEMDDFEEYNYKYGLLGSDQALRDMAYNVLFCLRPDDHAGRYIGEQFAVFLPGASLPDVCAAAERLKVAISSSIVVLPSGDALPSISASLGISQAYFDNDTLDSLFARATEALQHAKESGGNCVRYVE